MAAGPRARLILNTITTVAEHGVHGTGLDELLERSEASSDSMKQHFPLGRDELVETAARSVQRMGYSVVSRMADTLAAAPSLEGWLDELFVFWRAPLETSDYKRGSFMMGTALYEPDPGVQSTAGRAFAEWTARLADGLIAAGVEESTACSLAGFILLAVEGAIVQSRALRSSHPFDCARTQLAVLLRHHLPSHQ